MTFAARVLAIAALAVATFARAEGTPPAAADWQAIRHVIGDQLVALRKDDGPRAFAFATPGLQAQFGSAENFMRMVHAGYQPLIDARYDEFLEGAVVDGRVIQPLRLILRDDTVLVALYTMQRDEGGRWRIAGCMIAPSTLKSASMPRSAPSRDLARAGPSRASVAPTGAANASGSETVS